MSYKVSVVTPFYRVEQSVFQRSFASVMAQTIGFENIEYIIVVHNSTEEDAATVRALAEGHPNVRVLILNNEFHTASSPRNYGLKQAKGDSVTFLDADDTLYPDALEKSWQAMCEEHADMVLFRFDTSTDGNRIVAVRQYSLFDQTQERIVLEKGRWDQRKLITGMSMNVCTKLYSGAFIRDNSLYFDDKVSFAEDGLYNVKAFAIAERIVVMPQLIGYQYYQNEGSSMQTFKRKESDLWELCKSITKLADIGWSYGVYMDAYITEVAATTGSYMLCSGVRYSFFKKASQLILPYLEILKPLEETKIDSRKNLLTFHAINRLVYERPLLAGMLTFLLRTLHIDLEKIIKENVSI